LLVRQMQQPGNKAMRDNPVLTTYSHDNEYRYEVIDRQNGTFQVWVQQKIRDDYMGDLVCHGLSVQILLHSNGCQACTSRACHVR
jgi:hypothetical protein